MVQHYGFDLHDPQLQAAGWTISAHIITFENLYGLDPDRLDVIHQRGAHRLAAARLTWAGGQERAEGQAALDATETEDGLAITFSAQHTQTIRTTKIILSGLPDGLIIGPRWDERPVGNGHVFGYPLHFNVEPIHTPLLFLKTESGDYYYFRSLDTQVRRKGFAVYHDPRGSGVVVELLHDELGPRMGDHIETPAWRVGVTREPEAIVHQHMRHLEQHFGLLPWEENPFVPGWLRQVGLVAYIHGQHWSGYIFNDYAETLRVLRRLSERVEGKHILAHLAGWEGRYYWQYGDSRPDPRMGGEDGFRRLVEEAHGLGIHIQLMLGGNCANTATPGFERWGRPSILRSAGGMEIWGNQPDWDLSRTFDTPWQAWMNPGAPGWQQHLLANCARLVEGYAIDAIFLDTYGMWANDPVQPVYPGLLQLRDAFHAAHPDVFFTGENWWDLMPTISPMTHDDGLYLGRWREFFHRYSRGYAFNGWGDPSRDSTGVNEAGYLRYKPVPDAPYLIPSLIVVDGTLENAPQAVDDVLRQSQRWIAQNLH